MNEEVFLHNIYQNMLKTFLFTEALQGPRDRLTHLFLSSSKWRVEEKY